HPESPASERGQSLPPQNRETHPVWRRTQGSPNGRGRLALFEGARIVSGRGGVGVPALAGRAGPHRLKPELQPPTTRIRACTPLRLCGLPALAPARKMLSLLPAGTTPRGPCLALSAEGMLYSPRAELTSARGASKGSLA